MMTTVYLSVLVALSLIILLVLARVILGPTIWDRLLALNLIESKVLIAIIILALIFELNYLLDIALVYAVLGFIGTVLLSRFVERRGTL
ncbi:MAG: pH regulation protein F [Clostridiales bacterium]|nr:pH regulation protein F [Clostridiales bacterium]